MPWAQANMKNVRQEVIRRLYNEEDVIIGTASGGSTTSITDAGTTDGVHLESAILSNRNYIGSYVYVAAVAVPKWSRVTAYDPGAGTLTLSPALGATASGQEYEIHYKIHPDRINQWIKDRARIGSRQALDTIDEGVAINLDYNVMAEGVLADCKRVLSKRFAAGDPERARLSEEALDHEARYQEGLIMHGYGPSWFTDEPNIEPNEVNTTLRPATRTPSVR